MIKFIVVFGNIHKLFFLVYRNINVIIASDYLLYIERKAFGNCDYNFMVKLFYHS